MWLLERLTFWRQGAEPSEAPFEPDGHLSKAGLSSLLDARLSSDEAARARVHLDACASCSVGLAELRQTVALLRALPEERVPRSFALPAPSPKTATRNTILMLPSPRSLRLASGTLAAVFVFLLGVNSLSPIRQEATTPSSPPVSVTASAATLQAPSEESQKSASVSASAIPTPDRTASSGITASSAANDAQSKSAAKVAPASPQTAAQPAARSSGGVVGPAPAAPAVAVPPPQATGAPAPESNDDSQPQLPPADNKTQSAQPEDDRTGDFAANASNADRPAQGGAWSDGNRVGNSRGPSTLDLLLFFSGAGSVILLLASVLPWTHRHDRDSG